MSAFAKLLLDAKQYRINKVSFVVDLTTVYPRVDGSVEGAESAWMCIASDDRIVYRATGRTGEEALRRVLDKKKGKGDASQKGKLPGDDQRKYQNGNGRG